MYRKVLLSIKKGVKVLHRLVESEKVAKVMVRISIEGSELIARVEIIDLFPTIHIKKNIYNDINALEREL